jgi:hypothetical protein
MFFSACSRGRCPFDSGALYLLVRIAWITASICPFAAFASTNRRHVRVSLRVTAIRLVGLTTCVLSLERLEFGPQIIEFALKLRLFSFMIGLQPVDLFLMLCLEICLGLVNSGQHPLFNGGPALVVGILVRYGFW